MFWKTSLDQSSVILPPFTHFFPPLPHINIGYFDDPNSCNTEIIFFNIDMGVGGGGDQSIYRWKTCFFQKFLHTIVDLLQNSHQNFQLCQYCWLNMCRLHVRLFQVKLKFIIKWMLFCGFPVLALWSATLLTISFPGSFFLEGKTWTELVTCHPESGW